MENTISYALICASTNVVKKYHYRSQFMRLILLHLTHLEEQNFDMEVSCSPNSLVSCCLLCEQFLMFPDSSLVFILVLDNVMDIILKYELIKSCFLYTCDRIQLNT